MSAEADFKEGCRRVEIHERRLLARESFFRKIRIWRREFLNERRDVEKRTCAERSQFFRGSYYSIMSYDDNPVGADPIFDLTRDFGRHQRSARFHREILAAIHGRSLTDAGRLAHHFQEASGDNLEGLI